MVTTGLPAFCLAEAVMHFPGRFSRRGEREFVGMDLHIDEEQVGIVFQDPGDDMGHAGAHLVLNHGIRTLNKEADEFFVPPGIPGDVQDILDNLPAVIEPEPELFIVKGKGDILAGLFRILVFDKGKEERPLRCFAPVANPGNGRKVADKRLYPSG